MDFLALQDPTKQHAELAETEVSLIWINSSGCLTNRTGHFASAVRCPGLELFGNIGAHYATGIFISSGSQVSFRTAQAMSEASQSGHAWCPGRYSPKSPQTLLGVDNYTGRESQTAVIRHYQIGDAFFAADHVRCQTINVARSDIGLLSEFDRIINFDVEISNSALNFRMSQQELNGSQVPGSPIDQHRFGSAQRVRAKFARVQPNAGHLFLDEPSILARGQAPATTATGKQELSWLALGQSKIIIDCLSRVFG